MAIGLCINVSSIIKPDKVEIKFYEAEEWSPESEKQFLAKIQDILSIARKFSNTFQVSIAVVTNEVSEISFLLNKKINSLLAVNNQKLTMREIEVLGFIMQ